jgi:hypothetical protein
MDHSDAKGQGEREEFRLEVTPLSAEVAKVLQLALFALRRLLGRNCVPAYVVAQINALPGWHEQGLAEGKQAG